MSTLFRWRIVRLHFLLDIHKRAVSHQARFRGHFLQALRFHQVHEVVMQAARCDQRVRRVFPKRFRWRSGSRSAGRYQRSEK